MNSNRGSVRRSPTEDVGRQIAPTAAYVVLSLVFIKRRMAMEEKMRQTVLSHYIWDAIADGGSSMQQKR